MSNQTIPIDRFMRMIITIEIICYNSLIISEKAISWDFDDTVFDRGEFARGLSYAKAQFTPSAPFIPALADIPVLNREVVDGPINLFERLSLVAHSRRPVDPQARELIEAARNDRVDNFGNTGRRNHRLWVEMTESALRFRTYASR